MAPITFYTVAHVETVINDARDKFIKEIVKADAPYFFDRTAGEILMHFCEYINGVEGQ